MVTSSLLRVTLKVAEFHLIEYFQLCAAKWRKNAKFSVKRKIHFIQDTGNTFQIN